MELLALPYIHNYSIEGQDLNRPWGGFYYINNKDTDRFRNQYFGNIDINVPISGKILIINPNKRLSWQYHNRRKEMLAIIEGPAGIIRSNNDLQTDPYYAENGDIIIINEKERHRLMTFNNYAIVAELWLHTDLNRLSDENDIIRIQDDFQR